MQQKIRMVLCALIAMISFSASASAAGDDMKFIADMGYDFGGDTLVSGKYSDGSSWSIKANGGFFISGGVSLPNGVDVPGSLETQATIGYKYGSVTGSNGSITFTTIPITVIEQYTADNGLTAGVGLTYQMSPEVKGSGVLSAINFKFDSTIGYLVQAGYTADTVTYGVRYTMVDYTLTGGIGKAKGNGFGIYLLGKF